MESFEKIGKISSSKAEVYKGYHFKWQRALDSTPSKETE